MSCQITGIDDQTSNHLLLKNYICDKNGKLFQYIHHQRGGGIFSPKIRERTWVKPHATLCTKKLNFEKHMTFSPLKSPSGHLIEFFTTEPPFFNRFLSNTKFPISQIDIWSTRRCIQGAYSETESPGRHQIQQRFIHQKLDFIIFEQKQPLLCFP